MEVDVRHIQDIQIARYIKYVWKKIYYQNPAKTGKNNKNKNKCNDFTKVTKGKSK